MKLPNVPINKVSVTTAIFGIIAGVALVAGSATGNTAQLNVQKTAAKDTSVPTKTNTPVVSQHEVTTPVNNQAAPTTTSIPATAVVPSTVSTPATSDTPVPPTLVDVTQTTAEDGDKTIYTCHYAMSDGTSYDKFAGAAPTEQAQNNLIEFACPTQ